MGSSCFYLDRKMSEKRPAAPFNRTVISLVGVNRPFTLERNKAPVPPKYVKDYQFFDMSAEQIGSYPLALHHSIPFNLLKSSWDPILLFCTPESIAALWAHYVKFHPKLSDEPNTIESLTTKLLSIRNKYGPATGQTQTFDSYAKAAYTGVAQDNTSGAFTNDEANVLEVILCWGGWNLTEGPEGAIRIEDPGEAYDEFCDCCPSPSLKVRYRAVARLNGALQKISGEYAKLAKTAYDPSVASTWSNEIMEAIEVLKALDSNQRALINVDPLMWAPVPAGSYKGRILNLTNDEMMTININSKDFFRQYKCGRYK
jgi:hypothetical protein